MCVVCCVVLAVFLFRLVHVVDCLAFVMCCLLFVCRLACVVLFVCFCFVVVFLFVRRSLWRVDCVLDGVLYSFVVLFRSKLIVLCCLWLFRAMFC